MSLPNLNALEAEWAVFMENKAGSRKDWSQDQRWRFDNPGELGQLETYRAGGVRPVLNTVTGRRMVFQVDAYRLAKDDDPVPPPPGDLPFQEAQLRPGFVTLTTADIPVGTQYFTLPPGTDCLLDMGWVKRDRALKIYTQPGQRVHAKNVFISVDTNVGSAYTRSGFGYRPKDLNAAPAEHLSLTGCLLTGAWLADGLTFGDSTQTAGPGAVKVTYQKFRVESNALVNGGKPSVDTTEHCDAFQMQGPLNIIEFGLGTFYRQWAAPGNHPGKGLMLNAYQGSGLRYQVRMTEVNVRDFPGATGCGAAWIKDEAEILMVLEDVYCLNEGNPSSSWAWSSSSGWF